MNPKGNPATLIPSAINVTKRGRGRPKAAHTIEAEKARQTLITEVATRLRPILDAKFDLALGHNVMMAREFETDKKTGEKKRTGRWYQVSSPYEVEQLLNGSGRDDDYYKIWMKEPDAGSLQYLLNQTIGKPPETFDITSKGEQINNLTFLSDAELIILARGNSAQGGDRTDRPGNVEAVPAAIHEAEFSQLPEQLAPRADLGEVASGGEGRDQAAHDLHAAAAREE